MCKCTPEIRTPFCGKQGCEWPNKSIEGPASYYHPGDSTGSTEFLAMQTVKVCPNPLCDEGEIWIKEQNKYILCDRCHGDGELRNRVKYDPDFQGIALPESVCDYFGRPIWLAKFEIQVNEIGEFNGKEVKFHRFCHAWYNDKMKDHNCRCGHDKSCHKPYQTHSVTCAHISPIINDTDPMDKPIEIKSCSCMKYEQRICDLQLGTTKALGLDLKQGLWRIKLTMIG